MYNAAYIFHSGEFYFRLRQLIAFPVWDHTIRPSTSCNIHFFCGERVKQNLEGGSQKKCVGNFFFNLVLIGTAHFHNKPLFEEGFCQKAIFPFAAKVGWIHLQFRITLIANLEQTAFGHLSQQQTSSFSLYNWGACIALCRHVLAH